MVSEDKDHSLKIEDMEQKNFTIGVVISTYNNPRWLEKTLWGYLYQTRPADEIVIADDGSRDDTRQLIERFKLQLPIKHVWHEDQGFQKTEILNKAIVAAEADYLIFTDQDCIPREDFIATHARHAERGYFLSGGYFKLPMDTSLCIAQADVESGNAFRLKWLHERGLKYSFKCSKLFRSPLYAWLLNHITPARASWNGCNASGWRTDALAVNGFNEQMHYGGEDREFGERLVNLGLRSKQLRYSAILLHLDHKRPYKNKEEIKKNVAIRKNTRRQRIIETPNGIRK
jgi:glycosyltransferase involved in cell wall biosynthesis